MRSDERKGIPETELKRVIEENEREYKSLGLRPEKSRAKVS